MASPRPTHSSQLTKSVAAGLSVAVAVTLGLASVRAQVPLREYQIKAAFVLEFLRFVEWGSGSGNEVRPEPALRGLCPR